MSDRFQALQHINQSFNEATEENIITSVETSTTKSFLEPIEEYMISSSLKRQGNSSNSIDHDSVNVTTFFSVPINQRQLLARNCKQAKIEVVKVYHVDPVKEVSLPFDIDVVFKNLNITFLNRLNWPQNSNGR
jgi:hypothetical protein